jgi:enoyl-CoA hydratase
VGAKAVDGKTEIAVNKALIDAHFARETVRDIVASLEADATPWAQETASALRKRSPLMLHVVLEQIRRGRGMGLAEDLRMERDLVWHCFHLRSGARSETVEGIRSLAIDKDHAPKWNPPRIEDVTPDMVAPFFQSPWPAHAHPLRELA